MHKKRSTWKNYFHKFELISLKLKKRTFLFDFTAQKNFFAHREFSFTLKDDVYIRFQSFTDQKELEKEIINRCPYKIDIGAVYSLKVSELISYLNTYIICRLSKDNLQKT